jgi:hypothetical protein
MNLEMMQSRGIYNFVTYADNTAIGYFLKQGFTISQINGYRGYIK